MDFGKNILTNAQTLRKRLNFQASKESVVTIADEVIISKSI